MQLKIIQISSQDECNFTQVGEARIVLVDRKVDTYISLKSLVLNAFFEGQQVEE